jgi:hypothetical protein
MTEEIRDFLLTNTHKMEVKPEEKDEASNV